MFVLTLPHVFGDLVHLRQNGPQVVRLRHSLVIRAEEARVSDVVPVGLLECFVKQVARVSFQLLKPEHRLTTGVAWSEVACGAGLLPL